MTEVSDPLVLIVRLPLQLEHIEPQVQLWGWRRRRKCDRFDIKVDDERRKKDAKFRMRREEESV
jgi:hypothetical protein